MAIEKLQKLMIDADGHGFYEADDADTNDAVCEYSKAQAYIDRLEQENAELKAQLEALSWREIDDTHLPKVGDEVGRDSFERGRGRRETGRWRVIKVSWTMAKSDYFGWTQMRWTHYRPITPPQPKGTVGWSKAMVGADNEKMVRLTNAEENSEKV